MAQYHNTDTEAMFTDDNTDTQAMSTDATTSRSSSLASLFSQDRMVDVVSWMDVDKAMQMTPQDLYDASRLPSSSPFFDAGPSTFPRDSGYASNDIYKAWPVDETRTSHDDSDRYNNTATRIEENHSKDDTDDDDSSDEDTSDEDSSEDLGEYVPPDPQEDAKNTLIMVSRLRQAFARYTTPESRSHAIEKKIQRADFDGNLRHILWPYFYQYPEDLPEDLELDRELEWLAARKAGYVDVMMEGHEDEEKQLDTWERQQECFGNWNWPKEKCASEFPFKKGPMGENLRVNVEPPRGCTWASLREEQQRNLEKFRRQQQQRDQQINQKVDAGIKRSMDYEDEQQHELQAGYEQQRRWDQRIKQKFEAGIERLWPYRKEQQRTSEQRDHQVNSQTEAGIERAKDCQMNLDTPCTLSNLHPPDPTVWQFGRMDTDETNRTLSDLHQPDQTVWRFGRMDTEETN